MNIEQLTNALIVATARMRTLQRAHEKVQKKCEAQNNPMHLLSHRESLGKQRMNLEKQVDEALLDLEKAEANKSQMKLM